MAIIGSARANSVAQPLLLLAGFAVLVIISAVSISLTNRSQTDADRVVHTLELASQVSQVRLLVRRAESGQRGYLLTGNPDFLDSYRSSIDAVMPAFEALKTMFVENPAQQQWVAALEPMLMRKLDLLRETLRLYDAGDREKALEIVRAGEGRVLMERISAISRSLYEDERRLFALHASMSRETDRELLVVNLGGAAAIIGMAAISLFLVRRSNRDRNAAQRALEDANAGLESMVAERTENLRRANEELRQAADILRNTILAMGDAVLVVDDQGRTLLSNPAAEALFGAGTHVGSPAWQQKYRRFRPDNVTPFPAEETPISRAVRGENVDNLEIILQDPATAQSIHLLANGRPIRDPFGHVSGAVLVYRDVSEIQETQTQLRQLQKMEAVGQLTGGLAHDFNNLLTIIIGMNEILADGLAHRPELAAASRMLDEAAERGAQLIQSLLAFARRQPLQPGSTDVNELVMDAGKLLRAALGEQVEIAIVPEDDVWPALVDPSQLTNALLNLALNARDAMPEGGKLTIETSNMVLDEAYAQAHSEVRPGHYVMLAMSDTGIGIPAAHLERVFEPFFTTKKMDNGTGLGLSMVYGFIKQSNGHLKVYSEEGHGTTIRIYLPRADGMAGEFPVLAADAAIVGGREAILVVEDDVLVREYVTAQLQSLGYVVQAVANASQALLAVDAGAEFDLLFTDVILPGGMNGRQLADEVMRRRPTLKVLYTSGYTENAIVHHGRLDAGVLLLAKPYRKSDLARIIRLALQSPDSAILMHDQTRTGLAAVV